MSQTLIKITNILFISFFLMTSFSNTTSIYRHRNINHEESHNFTAHSQPGRMSRIQKLDQKFNAMKSKSDNEEESSLESLVKKQEQR